MTQESDLEAAIDARAKELARLKGWPSPRLAAALQIIGMTPADLSRRLNIVYTSCHHLVTGRMIPNANRRRAVAAIVGVPEAIIWPFVTPTEEEVV